MGIPQTPGIGIGGFSWSQIVDMVNRRTEERGVSLDLNGELFIALMELCMERRWWWRRRVNLFTITAGQSQYDLTSDATGAAQAPDLQQVAKNGFKIFANAAPQGQNLLGCWPHCYVCPEPVFDVDEQDSILALQSQFPPNVPCRFFIKPGTTTMLVVDPVPNLTCPAAFGYWAIPNYTDDDDDLTIPLLPAWMQPVLIKKLETQIERFAMGEEGAGKYEMVTKEYAALVEKAALYRDFADGRVEDLRVRSHQDAVQSTR